MGRVIGIDYGSKRSGVAMSDTGRVLASQVGVFHGERALIAALRQLTEREEVDEFVVGLPLNMDGTMGPKARDILAFRGRLKKELGLPVDTSDERLTTVEAHEALRQAGMSGRQRARKVDQVAAQIILQTWLDRPAASGTAEPGPPDLGWGEAGREDDEDGSRER